MSNLFQYSTWKALGKDLLSILFITGTVGIALKFMVYWSYITSQTGNFVYFPAFPNVLDSIFLICSVVYLWYRGYRNEKK